jgi:hypothetical protein
MNGFGGDFLILAARGRPPWFALAAILICVISIFLLLAWWFGFWPF